MNNGRPKLSEISSIELGGGHSTICSHFRPSRLDFIIRLSHVKEKNGCVLFAFILWVDLNLSMKVHLPAGPLGKIMGAGYHNVLRFCLLAFLVIVLRDSLHNTEFDILSDILDDMLLYNVVT